MANILIVAGRDRIDGGIFEAVSSLGHETRNAETLSHGLREVRTGDYDLVLLHSRMPDGNGIEALSSIIGTSPGPEVIVIGENGDPDEAETAIQRGAWDYVHMPFSREALLEKLNQALEYHRRNKAEPLVTIDDDKIIYNGVIGRSQQMKAGMRLMVQAARSEAPVLITGETGTGKEVFAEAIHNNSRRADRNFVVLDCAALPETLVESTLFGHTKGAFTGADSTQEGLIKQADGGTLFLDEVGELSMRIQIAFLRVLEVRRFRPVGGRKEISCDFRLVAATNRDLDRAVKEQIFRKDLLYRLRAFSFHLPSLKDRVEDIEELVEYHMGELMRAYDLPEKEMSPDFLAALMAYDWPGNIRELVNALERALVAAEYEPVLYAKHLPTNIRVSLTRVGTENSDVKSFVARPTATVLNLPGLQEVRENAMLEAEKQYLEELMNATEGDIQQAKRVAGVSRSRLYALLRKHQVSRHI